MVSLLIIHFPLYILNTQDHIIRIIDTFEYAINYWHYWQEVEKAAENRALGSNNLGLFPTQSLPIHIILPRVRYVNSLGLPFLTCKLRIIKIIISWLDSEKEASYGWWGTWSLGKLQSIFKCRADSRVLPHCLWFLSILRLGLLQSCVISILLPGLKLFVAAPELFHYWQITYLGFFEALSYDIHSCHIMII